MWIQTQLSTLLAEHLSTALLGLGWWIPQLFSFPVFLHLPCVAFTCIQRASFYHILCSWYCLDIKISDEHRRCVSNIKSRVEKFSPFHWSHGVRKMHNYLQNNKSRKVQMQFNWDYIYFLQNPSISPTGPREIFVCSLLFYSTRQFNLIGKKYSGNLCRTEYTLDLKKKEDCVKRSASRMTTLFCLTHPLDISFPPLLVPSLFWIHLSTCAIHT